VNRTDLQRLADERAEDALALLNAGRWSAAYYPARYAVECALKACIAKQVKAEDFPDKKLALDSYTHDIQGLAKTADVDAVTKARERADAAFAENWLAVRDWDESARYAFWPEEAARKLHQAVIDPQSGVLPWLKKFW